VSLRLHHLGVVGAGGHCVSRAAHQARAIRIVRETQTPVRIQSHLLAGPGVEAADLHLDARTGLPSGGASPATSVVARRCVNCADSAPRASSANGPIQRSPSRATTLLSPWRTSSWAVSNCAGMPTGSTSMRKAADVAGLAGAAMGDASV